MASALRPWHLVAISGLLWACSRPKKAGPAVGTTDPMPEPGEPLEPVRDLYVFAHDANLVMLARTASRRIEAASGVKVHVNEYGTIATAIPIFGSDFLCGNGTDGRTTPAWMALARNCKVPQETVMVHEMLHALGAGHLVLPQRGILNAAEDDPLSSITADDLSALCAVRNCTKFAPEA